jgi:hypothetical protein
LNHGSSLNPLLRLNIIYLGFTAPETQQQATP